MLFERYVFFSLSCHQIGKCPAAVDCRGEYSNVRDGVGLREHRVRAHCCASLHWRGFLATLGALSDRHHGCCFFASQKVIPLILSHNYNLHLNPSVLGVPFLLLDWWQALWSLELQALPTFWESFHTSWETTVWRNLSNRW